MILIRFMEFVAILILILIGEFILASLGILFDGERGEITIPYWFNSLVIALMIFMLMK